MRTPSPDAASATRRLTAAAAITGSAMLRRWRARWGAFALRPCGDDRAVREYYRWVGGHVDVAAPQAEEFADAGGGAESAHVSLRALDHGAQGSAVRDELRKADWAPTSVLDVER